MALLTGLLVAEIMQTPPEILEEALVVEKKMAQLADVFRGSEIAVIARKARRVRQYLMGPEVRMQEE